MVSLHRSAKCAVVSFFFLSAVSISHGACTDMPYIGGGCEVDTDCNSQYQRAPGTGCNNGRCECVDPTTVLCCARGEQAPDCLVQCLSCAECEPGTSGVNGTAACPACTPGTPGCTPPVGCESDAECPGPTDPRCGSGTCVQGECTLQIKAGPLASQLRGDCARLECTATGEVVSVHDPSDIYNDGKQCTYDACTTAGPSNDALATGVSCPATTIGRCFAGECVDCIPGDPSMVCPPGSGLVCQATNCVPAHCVNTQPDPGETSVDCGGPCAPCFVGFGCLVGTDCQTGVCLAGICKAPTCSDGVKNDNETGLDCGAPSCPQCPPGQGCKTGANCTSGVCWAGMCEEPSCFDGVRNDGEAGIDCGGPCEPCP